MTRKPPNPVVNNLVADVEKIPMSPKVPKYLFVFLIPTA